MYKLCKFQVNILFVTDFMNLQTSKSGCVNYAHFHKSVTYLSLQHEKYCVPNNIS